MGRPFFNGRITVTHVKCAVVISLMAFMAVTNAQSSGSEAEVRQTVKRSIQPSTHQMDLNEQQNFQRTIGTTSIRLADAPRAATQSSRKSWRHTARF